MNPFRSVLLAAATTLALAAQTQQPPTGPPQPPPQTQQPTEIAAMITGPPGLPPKIAVPDFIPLSGDADGAAKIIAQVLWDDLVFEREFYMIPRDVYRSIPPPPSPDQVALDRWKEVGADGVVVGTVRKTATGIVVEARLIQVSSGKMALGKQYTGSLRSVGDGGRVFAHTFADDMHQQQRAVRGVARTKLVYSSDKAGERIRGPVGDRDISNIYMSDYDGANESRLTVTRSTDITPVWAPDGSAIAYTSYRTGYLDIIVQSMRAATMPQKPAAGTPEKQNYLPAWSPNGDRLAFTSSRDGQQEIYVVNRDGSGMRRVTNHPSADVTPTWSPSGQQIAFVSDRTGSPQIYIINVDGTDLKRITSETHCDRPTWSPAPYNEIAYTSQLGGGNQIKVYDFATNSAKLITQGVGGSNESPAFAPNGRHIAFVSDRTGREQIYTIDRTGENLRQITKNGRNRYPNWSQ